MKQATRALQRRRQARKDVDELMTHPGSVVVIHYSCESFYDRTSGTSPRITSIAVANLQSAQTTSFSIHQVAERLGKDLGRIEEHYDELEKIMLEGFYDYVHVHATYNWLHWNMKSINYGFQAIAHRYKVLGGSPFEIPEERLYDLARLLHDIYGEGYAPHPRLTTLVEKNRISDKDFLPGAEEAAAFERKEYVKLHFSTLRKVDILASIINKVDQGTLKTGTSWRQLYGLYPRALIEWLNEHWLIQFLLLLIGTIASVMQIAQFFAKR